VSPRPSPAQVKLLLSTRGGVGVVKMRGSKDDAEFAKEFVEDVIAISEARKLDPVAIHVPYRGLLGSDDKFAKVSQGGGMAAEELNQRVRILKGT